MNVPFKQALTLDKGKRKAKLGVLFMVLSFATLITAVAVGAEPMVFFGLSTCILTIAAGLASVMAGNAAEHKHAAEMARLAMENQQDVQVT